MLEELQLASKQIELKINLNKTKIMSNEDIRVEVEGIDVVDEYVYLGHTIRLGKQNQISEISQKIRLSWAAFGKLGHILNSQSIPINLKRKVYDTCILPVITDGNNDFNGEECGEAKNNSTSHGAYHARNYPKRPHKERRDQKENRGYRCHRENSSTKMEMGRSCRKTGRVQMDEQSNGMAPKNNKKKCGKIP